MECRGKCKKNAGGISPAGILTFYCPRLLAQPSVGLEAVPERELHPIIRPRIQRREALEVRVEGVNALCLRAIGGVDQIAALRQQNRGAAQLTAGAALIRE